MYIPADILIACANLSERYITDRFLPDKAIDLLEESAACASIKSTVLTEGEKLNRQLKELNDQEQELTTASEMDYEAIAQSQGKYYQCQRTAQGTGTAGQRCSGYNG